MCPVSLYAVSFMFFYCSYFFFSVGANYYVYNFLAAVTFDEARRLVDPCTPRGYEVDALKLSSNNVVAGGNFTGCRSAALSLLRKGKGQTFLKC